MKNLLVVLMLVSVCLGKDTLNIGIQEYRPMIIEDGDSYIGHDIELWDMIAKDNNYAFRYIKADSFQQLFTNVKSGSYDAVISGLSITEDREVNFDFTHKYFRSGLGILVMDSETFISKIKSRTLFYFKLLLSLIPYFCVWGLYVSIGALFMWFFERGNPDFNDKFKEGFPDARFFVHVVISSTGFGNQIPKSVWGRRLAVLLMYSGIGIMFPMITGKISSEMTISKTNQAIECKEDLKGRNVIVKNGTTAMGSVKKLGARLIRATTIEEAVEYLREGKGEAIVHDIPALKYIEQSNDDVITLDELFDEQDYGILLPEGSPLKEDINRSILKFKEDGTLKYLKDKWINNSSVGDI